MNGAAKDYRRLMVEALREVADEIERGEKRDTRSTISRFLGGRTWK